MYNNNNNNNNKDPYIPLGQTENNIKFLPEKYVLVNSSDNHNNNNNNYLKLFNSARIVDISGYYYCYYFYNNFCYIIIGKTCKCPNCQQEILPLMIDNVG